VDYLVDPLALVDLSPLAPVFANPAIVKIFHAAEYDLICLKRDYHFAIQNVFDTMLAARILGYPAFGLGAILNTKFGLELDKKYQKADWAVRPMPPAMLSYARMDTRYLVQLRQVMEAELAEKGLDEIAREDFQRIAQVEGTAPELDEEGFWRLNGARELNPRQAAVLKQLYLARENEAKRKDCPPFKISPNDFLVELAKASPLTRENLLATGLNERLLLRYCRTWLTAIQSGMHAAEIRAPRPRKMDVDLKMRVDALKDWRKKTAAGLGVESDVILPRDVLMAIAERNPTDLDQLNQLMQSCPWRYAAYGMQILKEISPTA
jgi:ribonuclease D